MQEHDDQLFCPSFSNYSSDQLPEIAARVCDQDNKDSQFDDDDFEFSLVPEDSANELILNCNIRPIFPAFNRDLLIGDSIETTNNSSSTPRLQLKKMFVEESEAMPSSSSSEADELETIASCTYCVWRPKVIESSSPSRCKKSNSTGLTPKRWSILNLLRRSNSDGKDSLVFFTPMNRGVKSVNGENAENLKAQRNSADVIRDAGKVKPKGVVVGEKLSAHELFYVQNRAIKEGQKRKSYLPYRQDLVGFFANVSALGPAAKAFPPF